MSVIIRLQNLPWSANALDIRQYFHGLGIPEGGVHIVGGELGDAFIAFSTDEDARQAFMRNNGKIKEIQITLMLSSRTEMQRVIEQARSKSYVAFMQPTAVPTPGPTPSIVPAQVPPMPAAVPAVIPAAVPQLKVEEFKDKEKTDKKDSKRRSRSKSKDRDRRDRSRDRSRDRDRKDRRRDRSRSRSRDRKSRRRDRSRSRNRSRSRDRDRRRRDNSKNEKPAEDRNVIKPFQRDTKPQQPIGVWGNPGVVDPPVMQTVSLLPTNLGINLDQAKRAIANMQQRVQLQQQLQQPNGFPGNNFNRDRDNNMMNRNNRGRDNWPGNSNDSNFRNNRNNDNFNDNSNSFENFYQNNRFQRSNFINRRYPMDNTNFSDCCIALEPYYGGFSDVRKFFSGLFISGLGIKFINNSYGKRTGIVYIQFSDKRSKNEALNMQGMRLNGVEVNISHLDDQEFEEAIDRYVPNRNIDDDSMNSNDNSHFNKYRRPVPKYSNEEETETPELTEYTCLTVEDLPSYCKEQDILHMFALHPLVALILTTKKRGGPIAYVKFSSKDVAKKAFEEKSHHVVSGKPVTVTPCKDEEFEEINKQHDVNINSPKAEPQLSDCLRVGNLPSKTNDKDIADFFSDIGVIPEKIHLMSNKFGFTGEAYCEFTTVEEATRASNKNECSLGSAVISVKPIKREEMISILGDTLPAPPEQIAISSSGGSAGSGSGGAKLPKVDDVSPKTVPDPIGNSGNFNGPPDRPFFTRHFDNGPPPMRGRGGRFAPRGLGPRMRFHGPPPRGDIEDSVRPGCTVFMKNVPYKAGTNEILEFFDGFNHTGNVSRRYNPDNTPSDEAKVIFVTPDEASKAVDELDKARIWSRQIFLRQE